MDEVEILEPVKVRREAADADSVRKAAELIGASANPVFWVGGGAVSSGRVRRAAGAWRSTLQAPVVATSEGKGAISDRHYLSMGGAADSQRPVSSPSSRSRTWSSRWEHGWPTPQFLTDQRVLQIDIDEEEIGRNYDNTVGVVGDAGLTLEAIHGLVAARTPRRASREAEMEAVKEERRSSLAKMEPQASYVQAIRDAIPDDGIFVSGMTQIGYYSRVYYPVYEPGTYITSSYYGNLGFAFPTALGAKVACPDKAVVAVSGDGGFLFNSQELATAVQHKINAVVVVFNDNAFGNVLRDQQTRFDGRGHRRQAAQPGLRAAGGGLRRARAARGRARRAAAGAG